MTKMFTGLKPFQTAELIIMLALAFVIPFHWLAAQYGEVALVACAVLKVVFEQKFKFNPTQMKWKWVYLVFMATWLAYLVGMIHTENAGEGWFEVSKKLGFLLFPLAFLISDMSYLTKDRIRAVFYALVAGTLVFFLANVLWASYDVIVLKYTTERFFDDELMKLYYVHHTYMSMYVLLAFAFCFVEFCNQKSLKIKIINATAMLLMVVLVFLLDSRAGILTLLVEIIVLWFYYTFILNKKKIGVISGVAAVVILVAVVSTVPGCFSRITDTVKNVTSEKKTDRRLVQFAGYKSLLKDKWLFGVGSGDRNDETLKSYKKHEEELISSIVPIQGIDKEEFTVKRTALLDTICRLTSLGGNWNGPNDKAEDFIKDNAETYGCTAESVLDIYCKYIYIKNALFFELDSHNQFFDTMISIGIVGLLLLLAYFVIPVVLMIKHRKFDVTYLIFLMIIAFNALFESVFEVQVGIIFFNFFNMLLFTSLIFNVQSYSKSR
ncbi:MAG: O-antigen ligase family protein [Bacteroidales bacterium]|nr:O-antigen ligase family protein [Bacteroidales bacterium]